MFEILSVPVVLALVSAVKSAGMPSKFAPILSIVLGIIAGFLTVGLSVSGGVEGLMVGLGASGLYSGTKALITQ